MVRYRSPSVSGGRLSGPGDIAEQVDPQVHLQEGKAHLHPLLEFLGELVLVHHRRRVGVQADAVAVPAAEHPVDGDAVGLARQVPQGHLDAGDAAALPAVVAELPNRLEDPLHVARILAEQPALEHQGVPLAAAVADLAVAGDALVRVDPDQGNPHRGPRNDGDPQIGDPQLRRQPRPG